MALDISNREARHLWLDAQGLSQTPTGTLDIEALITSLGFVQLDSIRNVSRAHHHIIWSRNQNYREEMLNTALARDRLIFEHFTHDASILPMPFYPAWGRQFRQLEEKVHKWEWHRGMLDADGRNAIRERIKTEGPLSSKAFDTKVPSDKKVMWARPPHKLALDYMWYAGVLSTAYRENFQKFYDLSERVIPEIYRADLWSDDKQIDWLCGEALGRLGFGSPGDIQRFWAAVSSEEVKDWVARQSDIVPVRIHSAEKSTYDAFAPADIETRLANLAAPTSRLRILNPFDPVIRDRTRLKRLFGFEYRIEIFIPAAKRRWGYYVYPLLEGDKFVGRIEAKTDRKTGSLNVLKFWPEPKIAWSRKRFDKLDAELIRFARLAGLATVNWHAETAP